MKTLRLAHWFIVFAAGLISWCTPLSAAVIIADRGTGIVSEACDCADLPHDPNTQIKLFFDSNPIPPEDADLPSKYVVDESNRVVKRPLAELVREFDDEWRANLRALVDALPITVPPELRQVIKDIVNSTTVSRGVRE